jgi:pimeloyl-ACP methyl ester carboxylesterase
MTADKPTIVLIHGLWMTPSSWDPQALSPDRRPAGWEEVADNALLWALCHARSHVVTEAESAVAA